VLVETFIRKLLHLKAHRVIAVEQSAEQVVVQIDRLGCRRLRCRVCRRPCRRVHHIEEVRSWRDLSLRGLPMILRYQPRRVCCPRCGVRVEEVPWARPWARVTKALARAVAELARHLSWQETARHFRLDWKSVATVVRRAVEYGLAQRRRQPLHILGIDEVSRRKGHHYLTVVYDLERSVLLWVGEDRTEGTLTRFFAQLGRRRSATIQVVCLDMWRPYLKAVRDHATNAQVLFDRFHLVQHLNRAVDEVRRSEMRRLSGTEKATFKKTRFLLLKNPWNLRSDEKERLSTLVRWNSPIVRAYYLKEAFQLFWDYRQAGRAADHLHRWMHSAMRSRLEPFRLLVRMLRAHLEGVLAWTRLRVSNGALEGMNNKIKLVSHRSFGFRSVRNYTAAIYHCCARLPLPEEC
jgi:transposase